MLLMGAKEVIALSGRFRTMVPEPCRDTSNPSSRSRCNASRTTGRGNAQPLGKLEFGGNARVDRKSARNQLVQQVLVDAVAQFAGSHLLLSFHRGVLHPAP